MFTGLVETTGVLRDREPRGPGYRLFIATDLGPLELGESICVSGACLTVTSFDRSGFSADVSLETTQRTTLGQISLGSLVNLERSVQLGTRLGGHLVSGHVDGLGRISQLEPAGDALRVLVTVPQELTPYLAPKGSVVVDGVSLTINALTGRELELMLIPHTIAMTTFKALKVGDEVNLEIDLLARYVVHYLKLRDSAGAGDSPFAPLASSLDPSP